MKKSIRAVLLVFLSMVLMFGSVTSVWGYFYVSDAIYPLPEVFLNDSKAVEEWSYDVGHGYNYTGNWHKDVKPYAYLWFMYTPFSGSGAWPEEYLEFFDTVLSGEDSYKESPDYKLSVNNFSWKGTTLSFDLSATFHVKHYHINSSPTAGYWYGTCGSNVGKVAFGFALVVTDKESGKIVNMGRVGEIYGPDHADWYSAGMDWVDLPGYDKDTLEYTTVTGDHIEINMYGGFDPERHDIDVLVITPYAYFYPIRYYNLYYPDFCYVNKLKTLPVDTSGYHKSTGDVDGNGKVNLRDVSAILQHIANWELDGFNQAEADFDCDGVIDLFDARMGMKIACGWDLTK